MHRLSLAARVLLACVPALGLVTVGAGTALAGGAPPNARAAAIRALDHLMIGQHATNHVVGHSASVAGTPKQIQSSNWSAYADTATARPYSRVAGRWTQPRGICTAQTSLAAFWVGIDGYTSKSVEQGGSLIECLAGTPHYFTWWEMYPANGIQVVGSTVKPGDKIAASVVRTGGSYVIKVTDSTTAGNTFSTTQTCGTCANSSAEWIAEAPSNAAGPLPLTNFGTWTLRGAAVTAGTAGTISSFPDSEITMVNSAKKVKAQPGPLNTAGTRFKVTWKSAT
jgi:peptidase A4-like protein